MTQDQFLAWLRGEAKQAGSQRALARSIGISTAVLSDVLRGKDAPAPKLLRAVGYERRITYHKVKP